MTASNQADTPKGPAGAPLLQTLADNRRGLGIGLLIIGAALAAIPVVCGVRYGWGALEILLWGAALSVAALAAGAACLLLRPRPDLSEADLVRLVLLVLGGVAGFLTALLGLVLPFTRYRLLFAGGLVEWSKNQGVVWCLVAAVFGGLALMFCSLLLARSMERSSLLMRRLLYGYNAFSSSFLLLAVLLLVNAFCYSRLPLFGAMNQSYDWTASGVYTLSPATQSQLAALKEPVRVIVMMPGGSDVRSSLITMLQNCEAVTPRLTWQTLSPEIMDPEARAALRAKYDVPQDMDGMLVIYGTEPKTAFTFVKESELFTDQSSGNPMEPPSSKRKFTFKGEAALTAALDYLSEGKSKPVVYFTQGEGELSFSAEPGEDQTQGAMNELIEVLGHGNYDLRPLKLGPETKEVPADATIVVLARPRTPFSEAAIGALRAFLKGSNGKRGKLIALLNWVKPPEDAGLDGLLADYGVRLGHDRILSLGTGMPTRVIVLPDPRSGNALARRFAEEGDTFQFQNAQTVQPLTTAPDYRVDQILVTLPQLPVWTQTTDFHADPAALAAEARKEVEQRKFDRFSKTPLSVAVAVSESKGPPPIPGHEFLAQGGRPVMTVFGDADWIANPSLEGPAGDADYSLFKSTVDWLREKPTIGAQIKSRSGTEREEFSLSKITPEGASRLEWAPGFVMLAGIIALGLGVTLVRRR